MSQCEPPSLVANMPEWIEQLYKTVATRVGLRFCEQPGCWNLETTHCGLFVGDGETVEFDYCHEHAWDNGFCWGCGGFWSGAENFDFSRSHLCSNCEFDADDDFIDDEDYFPSDYPHDHPAYFREHEEGK